MKKTLSMVIRALVAAAGIGFIIWSIDWSDQLYVPAGAELPGQGVFDESDELVVLEGFAALQDPAMDASPVTLSVIMPDEQEARFTLSPEVRGIREDQFHASPGLPTMLRSSDKLQLVLGLLLVGLIIPAQTVRWWMLLHARGMRTTMFKAGRLTMVGMFFNFVMPGSTGGDVVKAYYAAKGSGRRTDSVMSVVVDRVVGLFGLVVLGAFAGLFMLGHPLARQVTAYVWLGMLLVIAVSCVYFSMRLRRRFGLAWLLGKLPAREAIARIDAAIVGYADHKLMLVLALLISVGVHAALCLSAALAGYAFGMDVPLGLMLVVLPVMILAGALPISFQGLGVMEMLAVAFILDPPHATANQLLGMLLLFRLFMLAYGLIGGLFLLRGDIHLHPQEATDTSATTPTPAALEPLP